MPRLRPFLGLSLVLLLMADCGDETSSGPSGGVATVVIDPATATIAPGHSFAGLFHATAKDAGGAVVQNTSFTWSSSNTTVATVAGGVGASGNPINVTTLAAGTTTITATCQGKTGSALLTVQISAHQGVVTGRVYDATSPTQAGIANATVSFKNGFGAPVANSVTTSADGSYTSPDLTVNLIEVADVSVQATGYVGTTLYNEIVPLADQTITLEPIPLVPTSVQPGGITGTARNARDNNGIAGATVKVFEGAGSEAVNAHAPVLTTNADPGGGFSFTPLPAGTYTVKVEATGFSDGTRTAIAVGNNGVTSGQDVILSPAGANEIRIVLTWGANPSDLDAHLTGPNTDATRFHVYYPTSSRGNLTAPPFALLDVDNQDSFGPETITITQLNSGAYRYSVHDYSNRESASSTALGSSGAKVELYGSQGLLQTFFVPNQAGTLWTVFELTGPDFAHPTVTVRNEMSAVEDPDGILDARPRAGGGNDAGLIARAIRVLEKAKAH